MPLVETSRTIPCLLWSLLVSFCVKCYLSVEYISSGGLQLFKMFYLYISDFSTCGRLLLFHGASKAKPVWPSYTSIPKPMHSFITLSKIALKYVLTTRIYSSCLLWFLESLSSIFLSLTSLMPHLSLHLDANTHTGQPLPHMPLTCPQHLAGR